MLGTVGDLVEDIVVRLGGVVNVDSDTNAVVTRRRGGSAANMAVSVVRCGFAARFIGQVGDDSTGTALIESLQGDGVEVIGRRGGRTGTIVVLVDANGQRTMLTDRGDSTGLAQPHPTWLDGLTVLHVPVYSLVLGSLASTSATLIEWAHDRGIVVSIDASSVAVLQDYGVGRVIGLLEQLRPTVLLCNQSEAECLGLRDSGRSVASLVTVVKRGAGPASVLQPGLPATQVPAFELRHVRDTTGAGDAFAAGFLCALVAGQTPSQAALAGHVSAARTISEKSVLHPSVTL